MWVMYHKFKLCSHHNLFLFLFCYCYDDKIKWPEQFGLIWVLKLNNCSIGLFEFENNSTIILELYKCAGPSTVKKKRWLKTGIRFRIRNK